MLLAALLLQWGYDLVNCDAPLVRAGRQRCSPECVRVRDAGQLVDRLIFTRVRATPSRVRQPKQGVKIRRVATCTLSQLLASQAHATTHWTLPIGAAGTRNAHQWAVCVLIEPTRRLERLQMAIAGAGRPTASSPPHGAAQTCSPVVKVRRRDPSTPATATPGPTCTRERWLQPTKRFMKFEPRKIGNIEGASTRTCMAVPLA